MSEGTGNVIPFRRSNLHDDDAEIVELILRMHFGRDIPISDVELSQRSLAEIQRDLGEPDARLTAFVFPSVRWSDTSSPRGALWTVVIDVGDRRAFYAGEAPRSVGSGTR